MPADTIDERAAFASPGDDLLNELEGIYKDLHAHPELSMQEHRTAGLAADWLKQHGYEVTEGVGGTGVVGLLRNGDGPTVLLRADMDALPIEESTGLDYASKATGTDRFGQDTSIAHSCGHDMHVVWLMGATRLLNENRGAWSGTVLAVFQPGEETAEGGPRHDRGRHGQAVPEAGRDLGSARDAVARGAARLARRHDALGRR